MDVALADDDVLDRSQAALLADGPGDRARDPEGDGERREHVEERVLARAADLVALADDLDRLQRAVAAAVGGMVLAALGRLPQAPHARQLGADHGEDGAAGEDPEHAGAPRGGAARLA